MVLAYCKCFQSKRQCKVVILILRIQYQSTYLPPAIEAAERYVFSHVCVCLSAGREEGVHMTATHDTLDLTVQILPYHPFSGHGTSLYRDLLPPWAWDFTVTIPLGMGPHSTGTPISWLQPSSPGHGIPLYRPPASDIGWPKLETCSILFIWGNPLNKVPHWYWHLVATTVHMVGKRMVYILLKCFHEITKVEQLKRIPET